MFEDDIQKHHMLKILGVKSKEEVGDKYLVEDIGGLQVFTPHGLDPMGQKMARRPGGLSTSTAGTAEKTEESAPVEAGGSTEKPDGDNAGRLPLPCRLQADQLTLFQGIRKKILKVARRP